MCHRFAHFGMLLALAAAQARPLPPGAFTDVTRAAGLLDPLAGIMGHGGAWGDFDGDGRIDLFVGGFCDRPDGEYAPAAGPVPARLFRNLGRGTFAVVESPASGFGRASGAVFADLDNNGTLDLFVANNARASTRRTGEPQRSAQTRRPQFFRNDGGKLTDISAESGACPASLLSARNIGVFDYDRDGLLDLFIVEDQFVGRGATPRSALMRNLGGLRFRDVTEKAGLPGDIHGLGLAVADVNGDGSPDFFVPHGNRLLLSAPHHTYREAVELRDVFGFTPVDREDWPCGAAFGDLDRDGRLDLVVSAHHNPARNRVFLHGGLRDGLPQFREVTGAVGLGDPVPAKCPHVEIQDFDNDGWPDIYLSAAWLDAGGRVTPLIFRNTGLRDGLPRFVPNGLIQAPMVYYPAGPSGDFDHDGRLDLFLVNWYQGNHCRLLRNDTPARSWLDVAVTGTKMNRMGIGAAVSVFAAGRPGEAGALLGFQEITTGYGYASGQAAIAHFGLGEAAVVDVEVRLPDGQVRKLPGVKAGQTLRVEE